MSSDGCAQHRPLAGFLLVSALLLLPGLGAAQPAPDHNGVEEVADRAIVPEEPSDKRILGVVPNFNTTDLTRGMPPLTVGQKFKVAVQDSFDISVWMQALLFAGVSQASDGDHDFGQGAKGFGKRYGAAFADQAIGNMLGEALFPTILKQDPRYFRLGRGTFMHRAAYAFSRTCITRSDSGKKQFNYSEWLGDASAAAISNSYYPITNRGPSQTAIKFGSQIALDGAGNMLKEFWPDLRHKVLGR